MAQGCHISIGNGNSAVAVFVNTGCAGPEIHQKHLAYHFKL